MMDIQHLLNMFAGAAHLKVFASDFIDAQVSIIQIPNRKILCQILLLFSGYYKNYLHNYILKAKASMSLVIYYAEA